MITETEVEPFLGHALDYAKCPEDVKRWSPEETIFVTCVSTSIPKTTALPASRHSTVIGFTPTRTQVALDRAFKPDLAIGCARSLVISSSRSLHPNDFYDGTYVKQNSLINKKPWWKFDHSFANQKYARVLYFDTRNQG